MVKTINLDKVGSITKNLNLSHKVEVVGDLSTQIGAVIAVEVLEDKSVYNNLELPSGRMSVLKRGDRIAVALGARAALKGFAGELPGTLAVGDVIHLLNFGGVAGKCLSANVHEVGEPLRIQVLGGVSRDGKQCHINDAALFEPRSKLEFSTPLIITTGTSMDSGKTTAAAEIVKTLTRMGLRLGGVKLTGVGAHRDVYKMMDNGVHLAVSFTDCGLSSTANLPAETVLGVAKGALDYVSKTAEPDAIVVEFGDGFYGRYGVREILVDPEIQRCVKLHVGCASDPVGAIGLAQACKGIGLPIDVMSGPVTDNTVGKGILGEHLDCLTFNAFHPTTDWLELVMQRWLNDGRSISAADING